MEVSLQRENIRHSDQAKLSKTSLLSSNDLINQKHYYSMNIRKKSKKYYHSAPKVSQNCQKITNSQPNKIFKQRNNSIKKIQSPHYRQKSYSMNSSLPHKKNHSYSRSQAKNIREEIPIFRNSSEKAFHSMCLKKQQQFIRASDANKLEDAYQVLIQILNYTIDFNDCSRFLYTVKILGDYCYSLGKYFDALKLYDQFRIGSLLQKNYAQVAVALIFMSKCTLIKNIYDQTVIFLKKALEYSWLSNIKEVELKTYDELGHAYYKIGDLDKAKGYHQKFGSALYESKDSPLRFLSKKKIQQSQQQNIEQYFQGLDIVFLVMLSLPYCKPQQLPIICQDNNNFRNKIPEQPKHNKQKQSVLDNVQYYTKKVMRHWMFSQSIEQPQIKRQEQNKNKLLQSRKSWYIDFKMNQYLRSKGIKPLNKNNNQVKQKVQYKESLDHKIQRTLKQPALASNWYQKIVKQVVSDQKRKLNRINSPICIKKSSKNLSALQTNNRQHFFNEYFKIMRQVYNIKVLKSILCYVHEL